jgi:hypothetical protein
MVSLKFFIDIFLPAAVWPWGRLKPLTEMSTRIISWGKGDRCVGLTTLPPCAHVLKSGSLNFLDPSGPVKTCNGIALPLPFPLNKRLRRSQPVWTVKKRENFFSPYQFRGSRYTVILPFVRKVAVHLGEKN